MRELTIDEAASRLERIGLKVNRIDGTGRLRTQFPQGHYIAIGEHVAKELAKHIDDNPNINCEAISNYFRARIFYNPAKARQFLSRYGE